MGVLDGKLTTGCNVAANEGSIYSESPSPKFWPLGTFSSCRKISVQNANFEVIFEKKYGKIQILTPIIFCHWKFAAMCQKIATSCRLYTYFNPQHAQTLT